MKARTCRILIVSLFCFLTFNLMAQNTWTVEKAKNDITVSTRKLPNSTLKDYKAEMIVENATIEEAVNIILNFEAYKGWFPNTHESLLLEKPDANTYIQYYQVKAPWPISNRDIVTKFNIITSEKEIRIEMQSLGNDFMAEKKGVVRMPSLKGFWLISDLGDGNIRIEQEVASDPGGAIPAWLLNAVVVDTPFDSFTNLRGKLQKID